MARALLFLSWRNRFGYAGNTTQAAAQLFSDLAITISAAVTASLIVAVTVLPTAAANLVKGSAIEDVHRHWWRWVTDHIMSWTGTPKRRRLWVAGLTITPLLLLAALKPPATPPVTRPGRPEEVDWNSSSCNGAATMAIP